MIAQGSLERMVPVENAAMAHRTVIQWDKDDLDALGLLKVDILALGMLSAIRRMLAIVGQRSGRRLEMHQIPEGDTATYDMLCRADSMGVFQVESRAQMATLPRLRPRRFYDIVVQVAGGVQADVAAIAARCTEIDTGARAIDNLLTNTLLPELSGEILARVTEGDGFEAVHIDLDGRGGLRFVFDDDGVAAAR